MRAIRGLWEWLWFASESARTLRATRILLAAQALWLVLSRPQLPEIVSFPQSFFGPAARPEYLRFGIHRGGLPLEWGLYGLLMIALLMACAGILPRFTCALSGLLLYHFAPFEEIFIGMPHTHFGGMTVPAVGLLILSFAEVHDGSGDERSPEYRWPVALIQLFFSFIYLFGFLGKLRYSGWRWFRASTIRSQILGNYGMDKPVLAHFVANRSWLCWPMAVTTLLFEATFWICVFYRPARRIYVPFAILFHAGILLTMNISFTSVPLLLLFVNWDWVAARYRERSAAQRAISSRREAIES